MVQDDDADGNVLFRREDNDGDGVVDNLWAYSYDGEGHLVTLQRDDGNDGTIDFVVHDAYDAEGYRVNREDDANAGGTVDSRETYAYDADGNLASISFHAEADGMMPPGGPPATTRTQTRSPSDRMPMPTGSTTTPRRGSTTAT